MLLLHKTHHFINTYSTATSSLNWRIQIKQNQLISQISSILLQRHNWAPLLQNLNLSSKLTPPLFLQILYRTQNNPQISFNFFNWAKKNLGFNPDLNSQCLIIQIVHGSGLSQPTKPLLDSLIQNHPASAVVESMIRARKGRDSQPDTLSLLLECYSHKRLCFEGLEVFRKMRVCGYTPSILACNALLDALQRGNEITLAWSIYGAMIRDGVWPDRFTWSLIAQILCKSGKMEKLVRLLDLGIYNSVIYNLVVDSYSRRGDFRAAFDRLTEMFDRKLDPGFSTYSSILDGACSYGDVEVTDRIMHTMVEKKLLSKCPLSEYDSIIQKLCDLEKTYAAELFFKRACDEKIGLEDATYGCMLRALSKEGRVKEAIDIYRVVLEKGIVVKDNSYQAFVNIICKEDQSKEGFELLRDVISRGYTPCALELSKFITSQCKRRRWKEAEDLLNLILEKGLLPDSFCCCSLMDRYCSSRQIDKAIALHNKLEKLKCSLDVATYNVLLDGLCKERRVEEAVRVFDYMKGLNLVSSASFTIIIRGLCRIKELRKAMKIHDEMLKMELKPDITIYKRLISEFK